MWIKVKKFGLSLSVIVLFGLYALQKQAQPNGGAAVVAAPPPAATSVSAAAQISSTEPANVRTPPAESGSARSAATTTPTASATAPRTSAQNVTATAPASGAYRDGSYTGSQADAHWGTVEVLAIVSNGQISDVQFTQYPNHRNRSQEINNQAMPILKQEAIQSQQAQVDVVSGATDTSEAFIQSLSAALSQAS